MDRDVQGRGLGSKLLMKAQELEKPLISFVMLNPLKNKPSLYVHLKNGFNVLGEYTGEYDAFQDYKSVGLIYEPGSPNKSKEETLRILAKL